IDLLKSQMKARHVERLQSGNCTIPTGFVFSDLITNQERVSDHCSNIAVCLIQADHDLFDTHEYLNEIKTSGNQEYLDLYEEYKEKYKI
ncbi:MAG: Na/Pi cotransporter family protein, partial [Firmicutes bacterium]|nr:Na/Pi cotransporter family protein [Bacillota bacterium]